jgi:AcrR family transcriptional regulator
MARPLSITDEEVLAAARVVFLDKGITATVEEVAARCGVGVATVFRRFPTKQALFIAAMDTGNEVEWARMLAERWPASHYMEGEELRSALTALANEIITTGRKMMPLMLMKMSNPEWTDRKKPPVRMLKAFQSLTDFFEIQVKTGRVNARDARVAARIWMGALQNLIMFEALFESVDHLTADQLVEGLVDLFCGLPPLRQKARKK